MEKQWITAPAPPKGRAALTVVGSVGLHGAIIAVAALWPVHYATPANGPQITVITDGPPDGPVLIPVVESPSDLTTPTEPNEPSEPADPVADTPPPPEEISMDIATPKPLMANKMRPVRPVASPVVSHGGSAQPGAANGVRTALGTTGTGHPGAVGHWNTPQPPYPATLRLARIVGSGRVQITTDGTGRVVSVSVAQSTGNALLDENTSRFARTSWSGPPNATITVPITYQMR